MRGIALQEPEKFAYLELDEPSGPGPGEALLRTHWMGVCGTDVGGYLGKFPFFSYPRIIGHELGVEVLEVGPGVTNVAVGDRCSIEPYITCGTCFACRRGFTNCCETSQTIGVMCDGGLRERFVLRADKLHPSASLSYDQLALVETLAIGCHACERSGCAPADDVLVIGAGPIGLAVVEFARLTGASITVMDLVASRLEFCRAAYGVPHTIRYENDAQALDEAMQLTRGDRYRVVIDATGNAGSMVGALRYVAHTGVLVYVGITSGELAFPHAIMHRPEMDIRASRNALPTDFQRIIRLMEQGTIDTGRWITHRTTFDAMAADFPTYTRLESGVIKAMVEVASSSIVIPTPTPRMSRETVLQFGAGRFLRGFLDRFIQHANDAGEDFGRVVVVQSTAGRRATLLNEHPEGFPVVVRGYEAGELVERTEPVASVARALVAAEQWDEVLRVAASPDLKWIATNATEAGYELSPGEAPGDPPPTMPGKLTAVLWRRFQAGAAPLTLLPCELIANNATELRALVARQARLWKLAPPFIDWIERECVWLANLVDCIITDLPEDHPERRANPLAIMAEPYALLAIERPARGGVPLESHPAVKVVDDLAPYYLRKVRILNGIHTAMVGRFLGRGPMTVQEVLESAEGMRWTRDLMYGEILPTIAYRVDDAVAFADETLDRFRNPHLAHRLAQIHLNHEQKVPVRLTPTRDDYERLFGCRPPLLQAAIDRDFSDVDA